ncbi:MAG: cell wall-active antibiotics response protein [Candidatus Marinimicrobia bacterium]|nr:cell wall-active antibiotics response protein [Candidatus Neomarinimicrobiota bacterium]MCF7850662.1 cell wall-active antibiotics response protein [Candidatus Neomarinimicrobiota bacterium]MCF7904465.1 cell wall-active antibiotics response protein [Candidatus Neomarinimicrobiota bacterium]
MSENLPSKYNQQSWIAIVVIVVGAIFLLQSLNVMHLGRFISTWWPAIFVIVGFSKLQAHDKRNGSILFIIGLILLSATLDFINWGSLFKLWPLIILYVGVSMLLKSQGKPGLSFSNIDSSDDDYVHASAIFGGIEKVVVSENFKGANILSLFGGVELDLRKAKAIDTGCTINVTTLFGGTEIMVPEDWNVIITGTPIFGGVEDKTKGGEKNAVNVTVNSTVAFGALELKA